MITYVPARFSLLWNANTFIVYIEVCFLAPTSFVPSTSCVHFSPLSHKVSSIVYIVMCSLSLSYPHLLNPPHTHTHYLTLFMDFMTIPHKLQWPFFNIWYDRWTESNPCVHCDISNIWACNRDYGVLCLRYLITKAAANEMAIYTEIYVF